ncbi:MAG: hypothetical protein UY23_C0005G0024 [Candidatus Jorgensenbacteria bacterium GW2011_GWA1_48_11]|uniref:Uncharacterized protein n=1 Tax=Candidatus Jorgensenbacteria bacterium GW2011_GWA1_48_11 TaxID=1618660 RepID=A0A0G1WKS0_9BACT|nr:MAG: hypothetical protein UY23_C0005G0024 [Candidatus Jorgensenbacteria bacterium GW2011_GWA1_48_11]KKW12341.1 MAG: hypothetical protein UY51_C0005G0583 [Candidatus Jorgensenbacteria bacterium GW2011_GWB1_49_9]
MNFKPKLSTAPIDKRANFYDVFGDYLEKHKWLHVRGIANKNIPTITLKGLQEAKENAAKVLIKEYSANPSVKDFRINIETAIKNQGKKTNDSLSEAILATAKNLEIVEKFTEAASIFTESMLMTGSNAWGPFYAVKGKSDIDLLITGDLNQLNQVVDNYVSERLIEPHEKQRFAVYRKLYEEKKVDQFSLISNYKNTAVSLDFLPIELVKDMADLNPLITRSYKDDLGLINVRIVREFRPNMPRAEGYTIDNLRGSKNAIFHSNFEKIKYKQNIIGYLSETLVDGQAIYNKKPTYFLGVMSFFLGVNPVVLFDKNRKLTEAIKTLHSNVKKVMQKKKPVYITRQERMPKYSLEQAKKSFSQKN